MIYDILYIYGCCLFVLELYCTVLHVLYIYAKRNLENILGLRKLSVVVFSLFLCRSLLLKLLKGRKKSQNAKSIAMLTQVVFKNPLLNTNTYAT